MSIKIIDVVLFLVTSLVTLCCNPAPFLPHVASVNQYMKLCLAKVVN